MSISRKWNYLVVEKNEIHLNENECHSGGWRQSEQDVVTFGVSFELKVLTKLEPRINHTADSERWNESETD